MQRNALLNCTLATALAVAFLPWGIVPAVRVQAGTRAPVLVVVNQGDHDISLIDPGTQHQVATVDVGGITGHEAVVSPDGRTAYVPIYGDSGVGRAGTDGDRITVIDLRSRKVTGSIQFGHGVRPPLHPLRCAHRDAARDDRA